MLYDYRCDKIVLLSKFHTLLVSAISANVIDSYQELSPLINSFAYWVFCMLFFVC